MSSMYYPPPESTGTFRYALTPGEKEKKCGFNAQRLDYSRHFQFFLNSGSSFGVIILRNGWMSDEYYTENVLTGTTFDIWSCTKSFTSMAFACLIDEHGGKITYESKLYDLLPERFQTGNDRRQNIILSQLLNMTSGLRGNANGAIGMGVPYGQGEFEYALGLTPNRRGLNCDLLAEPGTRFDYSDANFALLSLAFTQISGEEIWMYLKRKVLDKIGVANVYWDVQGGYGKIGPYTNGHTGLHISVRDLARVGYLLLNRGVWEEHQILPQFLFTEIFSSERVNPNYSNGFWRNTNRRLIANVPEDTFFMKGYRSNRCYVIPSMNLVVVRCGTGPEQWDEAKLLGEIVASVQ